jgi:allantoin racemase
VKIKYIIPYPFGPEGVQLRAEQIPPQLHRPGVTFGFVPVRNSCEVVDSYYEAAILEAYVIEAGVAAEQEGYDAVVMDSVADPGLDALRSRLTIPVIGPGQVAFHLARMLGRRFSVLTMWKAWAFNYEKVLAGSGLEGFLASVRSIDQHPDVEGLFGDEREAISERLAEEGRAAIRDDGADILVLGSTTMHEAGAYLAQHLSCPVINPGPAAVAIAEAVVDLGLTHSKVAWPSPGRVQDEKFFSLVGTDGQTRVAGAA